MTAKTLPARPDLDQYRKQAKDLRKCHAAGAPEAIDRIRQHHPRLHSHSAADVQRTVIKLADAQLVIARELGFESWPKLIAYVRKGLTTAPTDSFIERITVAQVSLDVEVVGYKGASAVVQFVTVGSVSRRDPSIRQIAEQLNRASFCTVLTDLFTEEEELQDAINEDLRFDIRLLAQRAGAITRWIARQARLANLPIGYLGSSTGAAACAVAATEPDNPVRAMVFCAGRPDLAGPWLARVHVPMLFVVGANDTVGFGFTRTMLPVIARQVPNQLITIDGATHRLEQGSICDRAAALACDWFSKYLTEVRS